MSQTLPVVALIGRPNVGKSTLFNRLIGARKAVVADIAGTTRDRIEQEVSWQEHHFRLVDMAGLEPALKEKTEIRQGMQQQVQQGLSGADIILWVTDGREGVTAADRNIAELLRRLDVPVLVAVNKSDDPGHDEAQYEFAGLGFSQVFPLSAVHGRGVNDLLDALIGILPETSRTQPQEENELRLSIVGRPNVGKSTLLNTLVGETRAVVSAEAGTTRDAVDTVVPVEQIFPHVFTKWKTVRIIDTAGIRRRGKIGRSIEKWSVLRSLEAIEDAEVLLFVIDGTEQLVHQDLQIAEKIVEAGKAMVLLINKWDAVLAKKGIIPGTEEDSEEQDKILNRILRQAPFLHWVQVLFLSAEERINVDVIGKLVLNAYIAWTRVPDQEKIDELTEHLKTMPRLENLKRISFEKSQPPVFHIHTKGREILHFSTRRYVENALRDYLELGPTPIKIWVEASQAKR